MNEKLVGMTRNDMEEIVKREKVRQEMDRQMETARSAGSRYALGPAPVGTLARWLGWLALVAGIYITIHGLAMSMTVEDTKAYWAGRQVFDLPSAVQKGVTLLTGLGLGIWGAALLCLAELRRGREED